MDSHTHRTRTQSTSRNNGPEMEVGDDRISCGCVVSKEYVSSVRGMAKIVTAIFSLIAFACTSGTASSKWNEYCYVSHSGGYRFVEFVAMTTFWCCVIMFLVFFFKVDTKVRFIAWNLTELIWVVIDTILFSIAFLVMAAMTCGFSGFQAGAAFCFLATISLGVNAVCAGMVFRRRFEDHNPGPIDSCDLGPTRPVDPKSMHVAVLTY